MPRLAPAFARLAGSLGRDARFLRQPGIDGRGRRALTLEKYAARGRAALGRPAAQTFTFEGRTIHFSSPSDPALLQRVITDTRETLDVFGLVGRPGIVAIDVGAHNGETAIAWSLWLDAPTIHSFEANPASVEVAARNLEGTGATLHRVGLGDETGEAPFDAARGAGGDASFVFGDDAASQTVMVPIARGDDVLAGIHPDLVKIDVEGYEGHVIAGLRETLGRTRFLTVEMSLDRPKDHAFHEIAALLAELRFELIGAGAPHVEAGGAQTAIDLHFRRVLPAG